MNKLKDFQQLKILSIISFKDKTETQPILMGFCNKV